MTSIDTYLAQLVARQHGTVSRQQLLLAGLTDHQVKDRVAAGLLIPIFTGVYRHAAAPPMLQTRTMAAVLAGGPQAVASHRSAARLHGLRDVPWYRPEITVPTLDKPLHDGMHAHRTNRLDDLDVTVVDAVPVTTVARTLLDLGAVLPYEIVAAATGDAIIRKLCTEVDLVAVLERLGRSGRRGTAILRAVVLGAIPPEGIQSQLEKEGYELIRSLPVEPPVLQHPIDCVDGRTPRVDCAWPEAKIAVDWDGRLWHAKKKDFEHTMARSRSIGASGWDHYRYGWTDVRYLRAATSAELLAVLPPASFRVG
jgi:hypothetical protein